MPQQEPFLFLEQVNLSERDAGGRYTISGREHFLEGHFKGNPVFPASIMLESLGQLAVFLLIKKAPEEIKSAIEGMLQPTVEEKIICNVEIKEIFKITTVVKRVKI